MTFANTLRFRSPAVAAGSLAISLVELLLVLQVEVVGRGLSLKWIPFPVRVLGTLMSELRG